MKGAALTWQILEVYDEPTITQAQGLGGAFIESTDTTLLAVWHEEILTVPLDWHPDGTGFYRVFRIRDIEIWPIRGNPVFAKQLLSVPGTMEAPAIDFFLRLGNRTSGWLYSKDIAPRAGGTIINNIRYSKGRCQG